MFQNKIKINKNKNNINKLEWDRYHVKISSNQNTNKNDFVLFFFSLSFWLLFFFLAMISRDFRLTSSIWKPFEIEEEMAIDAKQQMNW